MHRSICRCTADERLLIRVIKRDIMSEGRNVEQTLDRYIDTIETYARTIY